MRMRRWFSVALLTTGVTGGLITGTITPASATVHEIVASFCATTHEVPSPTGEIHDPPGLTPEAQGGTNSAENVAQPLLSTGAFEQAVADGSSDFLQANSDDPVPAGAPVLLVDEDEPQVKLVGSGVFFFDPGEEVWVEIGNPDPDFPAFQHCENSLRAQ